MLADLLTQEALSVLVVSFGIGIVVGLTGMGGGALMTPALIFLGVPPTTAVANDLVAASVNKSVGATVHWRHGSPNIRLATYLVIGSVPFAFLGTFVHKLAPGDTDHFLKLVLGGALLFAAASYMFRMYLQLRLVTGGNEAPEEDPRLKPLLTIVIGALGGLLVGITSVGSGSVIMIALLMLYPGLSAVRLVGTDLVQAVPLVLSAALANIAIHGLDWDLLIPLVIGSVPGTLLGARLAPRVPQSFIRRGIVIVLTMSGLALLFKAGLHPFGEGHDTLEAILVGAVGLAMLVLVPFGWGLIRKRSGLPMFGAPTVSEIESLMPSRSKDSS